MDTNVLVRDRNTETASEIGSSLKRSDFSIAESGSVSHAVAHAPCAYLGAVIAGVTALTPNRGKRRVTESDLRNAIDRLRKASEMSRASVQNWRPLVVIVTSDQVGVAEHAAAVRAGADLYLPQEAAVHEE